MSIEQTFSPSATPQGIVIGTDDWQPHTSGIVTTLTATRNEILKRGNHDLLMLTPPPKNNIFGIKKNILGIKIDDDFNMGLIPNWVAPKLKEFEASHPLSLKYIATEGPGGLGMRHICINNGWPFATGFHTRSEIYLPKRLTQNYGFPEENHPAVTQMVQWYFRWYHAPASAILVPSQSMRDNLVKMGLRQAVVWSRGVDTELWKPRNTQEPFAPYRQFGSDDDIILGLHSRVELEKNLRAFLDLQISGTKKVVIGGGTELETLRKEYPDVLFTGKKIGQELVDYVSALHIFVFPSKSDTYGNAPPEATGCGLPIAAFPVTGPGDVFGKYPLQPFAAQPERDECRPFVRLNQDLGQAVRELIELRKTHKDEMAEAARNFALERSWAKATDIFLRNLPENTPEERHRLQRIASRISKWGPFGLRMPKLEAVNG